MSRVALLIVRVWSGQGDERETRLAIVSADKCKPKKCRQECKKSCPVVRTGALRPACLFLFLFFCSVVEGSGALGPAWQPRRGRVERRRGRRFGARGKRPRGDAAGRPEISFPAAFLVHPPASLLRAALRV
jgi:hypothetical protein